MKRTQFSRMFNTTFYNDSYDQFRRQINDNTYDRLWTRLLEPLRDRCWKLNNEIWDALQERKWVK